MIKKNIIYIAFGSLLVLSACSQGAIPGEDDPVSENYIFFRTNLAEVARSRGSQLTSGDFSEFYVTSYFGVGSDQTSYFRNQLFEKSTDNKFTSTPGYVWPATNMTFVAWYPGTIAPNDADVIQGISVKPNIADHIDFVTAKTQTSFTNFETDDINGVALKFEHRLAQIGLLAKSENAKYTVEVAGVRMGCVPVSGDFNLNGQITDNATGANTFWSGTSVGNVEYVFGTHDNIMTLGASPVSIMGNGGNAMVIPGVNLPAWQTTTDASNANNGMYLSVLIRVTTTADDIQLYPAIGLADANQVQKSFFIVDSDNKIVDANANSQSVAQPGQQLKAFGWAAVPVAASWTPGKYYTYTLNYTGGVGFRDPKEPHDPGITILDDGLEVTVELKPWVDADPSDPILVPSDEDENPNEE